MNCYTFEQRKEIVKIHYKTGENYATTLRKSVFGHHNAPDRNTIVNLINKFERTGEVTDDKTPVRVRSARSTENIAAVAESVGENPATSIRRRSQQLAISSEVVPFLVHFRSSLHVWTVFAPVVYATRT